MEENVILEYILKQDKESQEYLMVIYELLNDLLGEKTTKVISYQMPTFKAKKNVIHFAAFKNHIGIYPGPKTISAYSDRFGEYSFSKGTLQIKYSQEIPKDLIREMALYSYELYK